MVKKVIHVFPNGTKLIERVPPFDEDEELDFYRKTNNVKSYVKRKPKTSKGAKSE